MNRISRRQLLGTIPAAVALGQAACAEDEWEETVWEDDDDGWLLTIYLWFGYKAASKIEARIQARLEKQLKNTALLERHLEQQGIIPAGTAGPRPGVSGSNLRSGRVNQTVPGPDRVFYLIDTLGNQEADGRIIAIDPMLDPVAMREANLGRADNGAYMDLRDVVVSPDGNLLIVSQAGPPPQWIFVDAASLAILGRLPAPPGRFPDHGVFTPDGKIFFATSYDRDSRFTRDLAAAVHIIDTSSRTIAGAVTLPENTHIQDLAITPDQALVFGAAGRMIHVIDVRTGTFSGSVDVLRRPEDPLGLMAGQFWRLAMHPDGDRLYGASVRLNRDGVDRYVIGVFDVRSVAMIGDIEIERPGNEDFLQLSSSGRTLFHSWLSGPAVSVFDTQTGTRVQTIPVSDVTLSGLVVA